MTDSSPAADPPEAPWTVAFRDGLSTPNATSLVIAAALTLGGLGALTLGIDEAFLASRSHWLLARESADLGLSASSTLMRLEEEPAGTRRVYLLGPSTIRMAVDAPRLEDVLATHDGAAVPVANLTAGGQSLGESLAFIERLCRHGTGIVVLGLAPGSLAKDDGWATKEGAGARYAIRADVLDDAAREGGSTPPSRSDNYFWDNRHFLLPRVPDLLANSVFGPPELDSMPTRGRPAPRGKEWRARTGRRARKMRLYEERRDDNIVWIDRIAEAVAAVPGLELVVLECPRNDRFVEERKLAAIYADFAATMADYAERHGLTIVQVDEVAGIVPDDFLDGSHMRVAEAIDRYTVAVADALAPLLRSEDEGR